MLVIAGIGIGLTVVVLGVLGIALFFFYQRKCRLAEPSLTDERIVDDTSAYVQPQTFEMTSDHTVACSMQPAELPAELHID